MGIYFGLTIGNRRSFQITWTYLTFISLPGHQWTPNGLVPDLALLAYARRWHGQPTNVRRQGTRGAVHICSLVTWQLMNLRGFRNHMTHFLFPTSPSHFPSHLPFHFHSPPLPSPSHATHGLHLVSTSHKPIALTHRRPARHLRPLSPLVHRCCMRPPPGPMPPPGVSTGPSPPHETTSTTVAPELLCPWCLTVVDALAKPLGAP
jgi:hypothetical protein